MSGSLPEGWAVATLGDLCVQISDGTHQTPRYVSNGVPFYSVESVTNDDFENVKYITPEEARTIGPRAQPRRGDILMTRIGTLAKTKYIDWERAASAYVSLAILRPGPGIDGRFLYAYTKSEQFIRDVEDRSLAWAVPKKINMRDISDVPVMYPRDRAEQLRIADLELTADAHLLALDRVLAKKRAIKQGMMQELLTGRTRLPGFAGAWSERSLGEVATILDNMRVPLSAADRAGREGHYPYCGANGIVDRIDAFMIDDDVVLLAEDGGNFDQWRTRPIAYRMVGKIWVNNHAHVLKAANRGDTGFLFYALEHKDITGVISSGTRSKLTRGELVRIPIPMPVDCGEQAAVASVLSGVDAEIAALERRLEAARAIKQGMMQELLTGHTRLVPVEASV